MLYITTSINEHVHVDVVQRSHEANRINKHPSTRIFSRKEKFWRLTGLEAALIY